MFSQPQPLSSALDPIYVTEEILADITVIAVKAATARTENAHAPSLTNQLSTAA